MPYTEMDNITSSKLTLISERARKDPKFQFTSLAHLLNEGFLKECYFDLGRDRAGGIDGVSWKEYGERLDENISDLVTRLKSKRYRPLPAKRIYVPKNEHEKRPLGLPALEDKIVQKGVARILEAIYEQDFLDCSYGYRSKRSCHQALNVVDKAMMRERFAKFDLELHPTKTRIISLDREQRCRTNRKDHQSHTFDFLGLTHYWGKSRKGNPMLCRKTSAKKFRKACTEMNI